MKPNRLSAAIAGAVAPAAARVAAATPAAGPPATGLLDVLNCGAGHLRFNFNAGDEAEVSRAKTVITDMLRRGYMLFVQRDKEQVRVRSFDPATNEYLIEEPEPHVLEAVEAAEPAIVPDGAEPRRRRGRPPGTGKGKLARVPMRSSKATGIGPTAGG